jgi:hypothetical protein
MGRKLTDSEKFERKCVALIRDTELNLTKEQWQFLKTAKTPCLQIVFPTKEFFVRDLTDQEVTGAVLPSGSFWAVVGTEEVPAQHISAHRHTRIVFNPYAQISKAVH